MSTSKEKLFLINTFDAVWFSVKATPNLKFLYMLLNLSLNYLALCPNELFFSLEKTLLLLVQNFSFYIE